MTAQIDIPSTLTLDAAPRTVYRTTDRLPNLGYFLRIAEPFDPDRVLVSVHGVNRDVRSHAKLLAAQADKHGYTIVAPFFDELQFPDYQRLGRTHLGHRADLALLACLEDLRAEFGISSGFTLFGFSGGAQFAHRFALAYPEQVRALIVASAGWYTDLSTRRAFPLGLAPSPRLPEIHFDWRALTSIPTLVMVGENDTSRDAQLRMTKRVDRTQGRNRVARARWWYAKLTRRSERQWGRADHEFKVIRNVGHSFDEAITTGGMDEIIFDFIRRKVDAQHH